MPVAYFVCDCLTQRPCDGDGVCIFSHYFSLFFCSVATNTLCFSKMKMCCRCFHFSILIRTAQFCLSHFAAVGALFPFGVRPRDENMQNVVPG